MTALAVIAFLLAGQGVGPPAHPDFSGEWVLVQPPNSAPDVAIGLTVQQPPANTTKAGQPMPPAFLELSVRRRFPSRFESGTYLIGIVGGTVWESSPNPQDETRHSVQWVGDTLVLTTSEWTVAQGDRRMVRERREIWRLDREGRLVIAVNQREGERESRATLTYRKREAAQASHR